MANPVECGGRTPLGNLWRSLFGLSLLCFVCAVRADDVAVAPVERWSSVFAESETRWTYSVSADRAFQEDVAWRLTVNQRTLASGELAARGDAGKPANVTIPLRWPTIKAGVVLAAQLTV